MRNRVLWVAALAGAATVTAWAQDAPPAKDGDKPLYYYVGGKKRVLEDAGYALVERPVNNQWPQDMAPATVDGVLEQFVPRDGDRRRLVRTDPQGPRSLPQLADRTGKDLATVMPLLTAGATVGRPAPVMLLRPEILAAFKGMTAAEVNAYVAGVGLAVERAKSRGVYVLRLAQAPIVYTRIIEAAAKLYEQGKAQKRVVYAQPNFLVGKRRFGTYSDPEYDQQWHLENDGSDGGIADADVDAEGAWAAVPATNTVRIAIVDDSVESGHPDLKDNYDDGRYYYDDTVVANDPSPQVAGDEHGTPCAGVALAVANELGGRGVAHQCRLIGVAASAANDDKLQDAFDFCKARNVAVISLSWSPLVLNDPPRKTLEDVMAEGRDGKGIVVVAAAGNHMMKIKGYQQFAEIEDVIIVGASDWRDRNPPYSHFGPELSVIAPGGDYTKKRGIYTTDNQGASGQPGDFVEFFGTSASAPLVAGICGLMLTANPDLTAVQVRSILEHTTDRVKPVNPYEEPVDTPYGKVTSHHQNYGHGRANAKRAVALAKAAKVDPGLVWAAPVRALSVVRSGADNRVEWGDPADDPTGVLVVRSDSGPVAWAPRDGDRFEAGDTVDDGSMVVGIATGTDLLDAVAPATAYYAAYPFSDAYRYGWGRQSKVSVTLVEAPPPVEPGEVIEIADVGEVQEPDRDGG